MLCWMIYVAPSTVENAVKIFVSLVSEEIRGNIHIYGTNKNVWMTALLKDFDLAELPPSLGGTKIFEGMDEWRCIGYIYK